jgi:hypothetical protein
MQTKAHPELAQGMSVNRLTMTLNDESQHRSPAESATAPPHIPIGRRRLTLTTHRANLPAEARLPQASP